MKEKDKITYEQAIRRIEEITRKVESGELDIDSLADNLKEAKELINLCKTKLTKVETDIQKILDL
ncbi:MAG: exodeoxyribonuclease VII small subunit [Bacteroidaceae bacterium]|nr:exodeoxyribonuclease VII small subunit [Bacteroidaceae bacterium]